MKSHRMIPILCILLLAVLLTACSRAGELTGTGPSPAPETQFNPEQQTPPMIEGRDTGRVALNGILLTVGSDQPRDCVQESSAGGTAEIRVERDSMDQDQMIAPGVDLGVLAEGKVSGTAQQAAILQIGISQFRDLFLRWGTYPDYTRLVSDGNGGYAYSDTFQTAYTPGLWNLAVICRGETVTLSELLQARGIAYDGFRSHDSQYTKAFQTVVPDLAAWIEARNPGMHDMEFVFADPANSRITLTWELDAGAQVDLQFALTWQWTFENDDPYADQADTLLGNYIAGYTDPVGFDSTLGICVDLSLEPAE